MKRLWMRRPRFRTRQRMLISAAAAGALTASLSSWAFPALSAHASTPVVVTLGFDDGTVDQFDNAFPILDAHGMHATFFVNTGPILAGDPSHMTWADLHALSDQRISVTPLRLDLTNDIELAKLAAAPTSTEGLSER